MARRRNVRDAPPGSFHHAKWHDWLVCRSCGAVVEDWAVHAPCPREELDELRALLPKDPVDLAADELAAAANSYGDAAGYEGRGARAVDVAGGARQIGALFVADWRWLWDKMRRRGSADSPPPPAPVPARDWSAIDALIPRVTRGQAAP